MKTFFRILGRILGGVTYYSTALLFAVILTGGIFAGVAYHYYDGYYQDYMGVQQDWAKVDNSYVSYINKIEENLEALKKQTEDKKFETKDSKESALQKITLLEGHINNSVNSMSYQEKFTSYPTLTNAIKDLKAIHTETSSEELKKLFSDLDTIEADINKHKETYNKAAKEFNAQNTRFPEKIISELGSFHTWAEMPL